jgi:flagellar L-ring protein precursor FlgH
MRSVSILCGIVLACVALPAAAQDLYQGGNWSAMASDRRAAAIGDAITVVVLQSAEASNTTQSSSRRSTDFGGGLRAGGVDESGQLSFGGGFTGRGEMRRSEKLVAQLSATIEEVLPNGDYRIVGRQQLHVNGENTTIGVRGRIRPSDIASDNSVLSSRIADAQIDYDGKGFVSRGAKPGLITRLFNLLGLL